MVQDWNDDDTPKLEGHRGNLETWQICNWAKNLDYRAGEDDELTFNCESVKITRAEEKSYAALFKKPRTGKNGYRTIGLGSWNKRCELSTHAYDGDEILSANEVDTDQEDQQINSHPGKTDGLRDRREERPQKRMRLKEVVVFEVRDRRTVHTKLKTPNALTKTQVKARRLILEDGSSTKSSVVASQGRLTSAKWAKLEAKTTVREKDGSSDSKMRLLTVVERRATRKEKGKAIMTEEGIPERNPIPSAEARVNVPSEKPLEVLTVSSDIKEYSVAL
ncbi:hypothetical protein AXG93_1587s1060 [Marchantia polymorpha subsp. ruderalis]|uniref:Uncharacterized protein n=1 Tax=Marchantia polymorpha subsp. ruderalis TaxID=1480154 RepID=A0A176WQS1_MARPO|nr:hypothetical protein AXG93_1587s1060 [Marchantia polymorpha subsp. ruderalis]